MPRSTLICFQPYPPLVWPRFAPAGIGQHSADLVSPSRAFHVVDHTHSGDSLADGGHPFSGVRAHSPEARQGEVDGTDQQTLAV